MPDDSHLDQCYFVSADTYNCPFCNRRHVSFKLDEATSFHWTAGKHCFVYFVKCNSCNCKSMHLSFRSVAGYSRYGGVLAFEVPAGLDAGKFLDESMFYSVPTSFFVMDDRIPQVLRELLMEAEASLKLNLLTGASACARKVVYEMAKLENAPGEHYEDKIKALKSLHPDVEPTYFDTLLSIQRLTSSKVHENALDGWHSDHLRVILASLREILHEVYVLPALRDDRRQAVLALQDRLLHIQSNEGGSDVAKQSS